MPILAAEPDRYPARLFADDWPACDAQWWVLHTKPRQEKSLARQLLASGIGYYLPTIERRGRVRNRPALSRLPLFPGYVFLFGNRAERLLALTTNRVARCLDVADSGRMHGELRQVDRLLTSGLPVTPVDRLAIGAEVEIVGGPLAGLQGIIVRTATGRRFVVQVNFIQQGAAVELHDFDLMPVSRQPREVFEVQ